MFATTHPCFAGTPHVLPIHLMSCQYTSCLAELLQHADNAGFANTPNVLPTQHTFCQYTPMSCQHSTLLVNTPPMSCQHSSTSCQYTTTTCRHIPCIKPALHVLPIQPKWDGWRRTHCQNLLFLDFAVVDAYTILEFCCSLCQQVLWNNTCQYTPKPCQHSQTSSKNNPSPLHFP